VCRRAVGTRVIVAISIFRINSGFIEINTSGAMCMVISRCSRVCAGLVFRFDDVFPVCVDRNMCSEYVAVISIDTPNRMIVVGYQLM